MASNELDIDKMLKAAEKGKSASSLGKTERGVYGITPRMPSPQPDQKKNTMPPPKSYAPRGTGFTKLPADIGLAGQSEALRAFQNPIKRAGKAISSSAYLPYRKPAIEGGEGPHAV